MGKRIKVWYQGVKIQCNHCYGYHKKEREQTCKKINFAEYVELFKTTNPKIPNDYYYEVTSTKRGQKNSANQLGNKNNIISNDTNESQEDIKQEDLIQEMDAGVTEYTNEDILRLLDEPCNLSTDEKEWLMNQGCETEEEVFTKCRELLKCRVTRKIE